MEAEIKKLPGSKIEILFEIPWQEFFPYLDRATQNLSKNLKFKGFREGKAPREFIEREIGEGKILATAGEFVIKEKYPKFVFEKKLEVIGTPRVEILKLAKGNPFSFKAKVDILPEIKLPDYKKIASGVEKKEISAREKEVKDALNWLQRSRAKFKDLDREAKSGDFLEIEYKSPQIENGKVFEDRFLLGKGHFAPGFEKNLQEVKTGGEKEFNLTFPKDYFKKELASKNINFKVKVKKIQLMELPELNDDFAQSLGKFEDLEGLRKSIKEGISHEKEIIERQRRRNEILAKIAEASEFEIPDSLVSLERERILDGLKARVEKELKISFKDYLEKIKKPEDELKNSFSTPAKKRVKNLLILREIGKKEGIEVSKEEIKESVNEFFKNYPGEEKAKKEVDLERLKEYYRGVIYNEKVFQALEKPK